jgi:hypothetical protein
MLAASRFRSRGLRDRFMGRMAPAESLRGIDALCRFAP